jgi:hypothetical protein
MHLIILSLFACRNAVPPPMSDTQRNPSSEWRRLLEEVVNDDGLVDYNLLESRRDILDRYVSWIAQNGPHSNKMTSRDENKKIAFYMNSYNALVMYSVLENRPLESVSDVDVGVYTASNVGFFFGQVFLVDGEWMSLYHLEMERLLGNFHYPMIHAGLNCASKGCPPPKYYTHIKLDTALENSLEDFLKSPNGARFEDGEWYLSELFQWYEKDFTRWSHAETLCEYLIPFSEQPLSDWLSEHKDNCNFETFSYDWSLNEVSP